MYIRKQLFSYNLIILIFLTLFTAWNVSKCIDFSSPFFPVFEMNTEIWSFSGPYFSVFRPDKTPYFDNFHTVINSIFSKQIGNSYLQIFYQVYQNVPTEMCK